MPRALAHRAGAVHLRATMSLSLTLILLVALTALAVLSAWRGARPPDIRKGPRMVPWRFLMIVSAAVAVYLLMHLVGIVAGRG